MREEPQHPLPPEDARLLDLLAESGFDPDVLRGLPAGEQRRGEELLSLLRHLDAYPDAACAPELTDAVLSRVAADERDRARTMRIDAPRRGLRIRVPDLVTIAAVLLLGVGVGWPVISAVRAQTRRDECYRNMTQVFAGLERYAGDHAGILPLTADLASAVSAAATAARAPDWRTYQHASSLDALAREGYAPQRCLTCPGCAKERASLAFRVPVAGRPFTLMTAVSAPLLADANPVLEVHRRGLPFERELTQSSTNHDRMGQNTLYDDGSVRWLMSPVLPSGDNIWVPWSEGGRGALGPGAMPRNMDDVFLAQ